MFYFRSNIAGCYVVCDRQQLLHRYQSLVQLKLDWPFAQRIELQPHPPIHQAAMQQAR